MNIAVIPARGGSKRLPGKNLRLLGGKPLVAWTIKHAKEAKLIDKVIVSSDDDGILQVAREYGVMALRRPSELCTDEATSESALLHALTHIENRIDWVVMLQCTSPFRMEGDVDRAIWRARMHDADSAVSVVPFHGFVWDENTRPINHGLAVRQRTQDRPKEYVENGSIYVMRPDTLKQGRRFGYNPALFVMDPSTALDIDTEEDFVRAQHQVLYQTS